VLKLDIVTPEVFVVWCFLNY